MATNPFAQFVQQPQVNPFARFAETPAGMRPVEAGEIPTESGFVMLPETEPQRGVGQRVLGAVTAPMDVALTLGSAAGRGLVAAPYALVRGRGVTPQAQAAAAEMLGGIRQPQTPEGRAVLEAVAPALSALPPVIGTAPAVMGAGLPAAQQAGRIAGQEAGLVRGAIDTARATRAEQTALQRSAADWQRAPQIEAAQRAVELGIALNPATSNPTLANRARSALAGNRDVNAIFVKQNAPKWTELAKRDMGLSLQTTLNAKGFEEARNAVSGPYEQLRRMGAMRADNEIRMQLENLRVEQAAIGGEAGARRVNRLVDEALGKIDAGLDGNRLLESIRQLRRDAQAIRNAQKMGQAPSPERIAEAEAKLNIAASLENLAENNIFDPKFKDDFRQARAAMAKTYAYEDATNFNTGQVDPIAIAQLTQRDNALTGIIADIGAIAGNFPEIASSAPPSTLLQRAGTHLTRSGIGGTIGAGLGAVTPVGPIAGGVVGAGAAELYTGLRARKMATPEYQRRFAAPEDRRIFPTPEPEPVNALVPYVAPQNVLMPEAGAFVMGGQPQVLRRTAEGAFVPPPTPAATTRQTPTARFVGPEQGPPQLPAPSAEATMSTLRAEDVRRAGVSRAVGREAEAQQAAAEAAARRPATGEVILDFDPVTGELRPVQQQGAALPQRSALQSAVEKLSGQMIAETESTFRRVSTGRPTKTGEQRFYVRRQTEVLPFERQPQAFNLTAEERIAWNKAKADLADVAPGFKALDEKAIAAKMQDREWVQSTIKSARERDQALARKEALLAEQLANRDNLRLLARDIERKNKELADIRESRARMTGALEALEERLRPGRPQVLGGQGPKTRAAKAEANRGGVNALMPDGQNRNALNK